MAPRSFPGQRTLCHCRFKRTSRPSVRIHSARTAGSSRPATAPISTNSGTTVSELQPGGIIQQSTKIRLGAVPATHPFQWFGLNTDGVPGVAAKVVSRYSLMLHMNGQTDAEILTIRLRVNQFLKDIGVTGVP